MKLHVKKQSILQLVKNNRLILAACLLLVIFGAVMTIVSVRYDSSTRAWNDMLNSSLQTKSVTVQINQGATGTETVRYATNNQNQADATTTVKQGTSQATVENIGTFDADYTRYVTLVAPNKNYKNVINVWAKDTHKNQIKGSQRQLLPDVVLRLGSGFGIPLVEAPADKRAALQKQLSASFTVNPKRATTQHVNNQEAYVYTVQVDPQAYAAYSKALAQTIGFKALDAYNPASDKGQAPVTVSLAVSIQSHRLIGLTYPGIGGYSETYSAYNKKLTVNLPTKTGSLSQLQNLLAKD